MIYSDEEHPGVLVWSHSSEPPTRYLQYIYQPKCPRPVYHARRLISHSRTLRPPRSQEQYTIRTY